MKSFLLALFSSFLFQNISIAEVVKNNQKDAPLTKQKRGVIVVSHGSSTIKRNVVKENAQKTIEIEKQRQIAKQQKDIERKQKQEELKNASTQQQIASNVVQFANQPLITGLEDKEQTSTFTDVLDIIKLVMGTYKDLYNDNVKQGSATASPQIIGAYSKMYNILDKFSQYVHRKENKNLKK